MKSVMRKLAVAGVFMAVAGAASADVRVNFVEPSKFTDLPTTPWEREQALKELDEHFKELGEKLPEGYLLKVDVLDVDMAGREMPQWRTGQDLRVLKGTADWPVMRIRYELEANGQRIKGGDAQLSDMAYLQGINRYFEGEPLRYEKQMIDEWFKKTVLNK